MSLIHPLFATDMQVDQDTRIGDVSQTGQWAPFNPRYGVSTLIFTTDISDGSLQILQRIIIS